MFTDNFTDGDLGQDLGLIGGIPPRLTELLINQDPGIGFFAVIHSQDWGF